MMATAHGFADELWTFTIRSHRITDKLAVHKQFDVGSAVMQMPSATNHFAVKVLNPVNLGIVSFSAAIYLTAVQVGAVSVQAPVWAFGTTSEVPHCATSIPNQYHFYERLGTHGKLPNQTTRISSMSFGVPCESLIIA
jgi:hypothetical protein